jgi:hypothetical protein
MRTVARGASIGYMRWSSLIGARAMPSLSSLQLIFFAYNAAVGLLVGTMGATSPWFDRLGVPVFAWLIAAMFAFEVIAGLIFKIHPSTAISMGTRIAAILISFVACFLTLTALKPA